MGIIWERANEALDVNPPAGDSHLNVNGSNWLWAVTAVYLVSFFVFFALSIRPRYGERIFHYLFATALLVGAIVYYAQASDLAWRVISQSNNILTNGPTRQVFWAKYVHWAVAFPVVIIVLGLLSGVSWASILYNVVLAWIWVVTYLVSALTTTNYKWGFFAFGTLAWLVLAFGTFTDGRSSANRVGVSRDFIFIAAWLNTLWLLYVIAFAISDGSNRIGVVGMFVWFGILDILLIPGTAFVTVVLSKRWDYGRLNLQFTQSGRVHSDGLTNKHHPATATSGVGHP